MILKHGYSLPSNKHIKGDDVYRTEQIIWLIDNKVKERQVKNGERTKNITGSSSKLVENINYSHNQLKIVQKWKFH